MFLNAFGPLFINGNFRVSCKGKTLECTFDTFFVLRREFIK